MNPRKSPPSLRRHKPNQQAVVTLNGRDHYLGSWPNNLKVAPGEVRSAYDALISEWLGNGRQSVDNALPPITVAELILQFWERYATIYYRHFDGSPTIEQDNYNLSLGVTQLPDFARL